MSRRLVRLFIPALAIGVALGAAPVGAADSPARLDARSLSTSRVVEVVEIGRLGESKPLMVSKRRLRGRAVSGGRTLEVAGLTRSLSVPGSGETCWWARPKWSRYNGFGRLSSKAWYFIEWCTASNRVTKVLTLHCGGVGAQGFSFRGCNIRRGSVGFKRVAVSGTWRFPFRIGIYTLLTRTITVSARHYATGRYSGTWWRYQ